MLRRCLPLGFLGLVCTACPSPNTFTTPRTVPAGHVEHTIAVETIGAFANGDSLVSPVPPSYTARVGLADRVELGLHLSHMSSLGADFKWNPLRSEVFDLAIDPGFQGFYIATGDASAFIYYLHAPLLLGFNLGSSTTIVLTPGVTLLGGAASVSGNSSTYNGASTSSTTLFGRLGFGVDFRFSQKFALEPEVTFLKSFESGGGTVMLAGLGFKFGTQPEYGGGGSSGQ